MLSKKDLDAAELETARVSRNPTKVITANGEVQTNEGAMVHVKDLDVFVTSHLPRRYSPCPVSWQTAKIMGIPINGLKVNSRILLIMAQHSLQYG